jgi:uncharacterized membrane protein YeaQ/YmgE (transglycosylase-associated protein family)
MDIIWTIVIGLAAGIVAKFLIRGSTTEPSGFVLTAILGIVGAIVATFLGRALGWYGPGEEAGFVGAVVGAIIVLLGWAYVARRRGAVPPTQ